MTELILLNVPFESNYKDTVYFATPGEQFDYMYAHEVESINDSISGYSYQRKDGIIRYPKHIDKLYACNYVTYKNDNGKRMYAFIEDMKYVNEERTDIYIKTDVIQTWMFDYTVKPSFVEREHVEDDTVGLHTVPEQLETGEYICNNSIDNNSLTYKGVILGSTVDFTAEKGSDGYPNVGGSYYDGVFSGVKYFYFPPIVDPTEDGRNPFSGVGNTLKKLADAGQSDAVVCVFMVPTNMVRSTVIAGTSNMIHSLDWKSTPTEQEWSYWGVDSAPSKPTHINGHTPRNKKLLTYPFCYLLASNNSGGANIYHYELFDGNVNFKIYGSVTPGMSIRMMPMNYGGVALNNKEGLNLGKFPICSWTNDVYTNWLTQNAINIGVDVASAGAQIVMGAGMLSNPATSMMGVGMAVGGVTSIGSTIGSIYQHAHIPPALEGNLNSGDVTYSSGKLTFTLYQMSIKREYAQIIDEYFDMFGYKVSRVKTPLENHRERWWFTKTIDVNIDGAIPNKDMEEIKQCYNKGITFWRANATMGDYSQTNSIKKEG